MKTAIVSFGHIDVMLPLAKAIAQQKDQSHQIDIYMAFAQSKKGESVINFRNLEVPDGFQDDQTVKRILGDDIIAYMEGSCKINVFIYKNLKIKDVANIRLSRQLARHLLKENYDVIHFNGNNFFQVYISMFLKKIPRVHTIHDFTPHIGKRTNLATKLRLPEIVNRILVRSKKQKIVHARQVKELISRTVKSSRNVNTVYYGPLDIYGCFKYRDAEPPDLSSYKPYILFFGRIAHYKGINYLIDAFNQLKETYPRHKLVIAGGGNIDFLADRLADNKAIVIINRYIGNSELADLIRDAIMVVCPYIDASQSGVIQTAYAFDTPVIATDIGGLPEVVEHGITGRLVPPADTAKLKETMDHMLSDEKITLTMAENIRTRIKKELRWDYIANQTLAVYNKAING
jgi:glycosyltransferase involved in cell wall biosynthesis